MIERHKLKQRIIDLLDQKSVVWLSGVRRVGKTTLCKSLGLSAIYFDCELPSVRAQLENPEFFLEQHKNQFIILDEIHRLGDPSNILKIAADHYPNIKIVATGSSTMAAKQKFNDTLTDRKRDLWVQPFSVSEVGNHQTYSLDRRLLHGGLPPAYMKDLPDDAFFSEWLESFWAKDVQELFVIDKKASFLKLAELILRQSGEIFEATSLARPCEISRQTVTNYLEVLSISLFAIVVRPYTANRAGDIISAPKVYGFDTGFVCFSRGWDSLRPEDRGGLLEHLVLSDLIFQYGRDKIFYWRNKQKHEVDFIIKPARGKDVHAIECKSNYKNFDIKNLRAFRKSYPQGKNFLYAANVTAPMSLSISGFDIMALPIGTGQQHI